MTRLVQAILGPRDGVARASELWYRLLTGLYPRKFRRSFGAAMIAAFGEHARITFADRGVAALATLWLSALADVASTALRMYGGLVSRLIWRGNGGPAGALERLWFDFLHAAKGLRQSPGFCAAAVLALALGIGANTAIFSLVHGILLRPLPFASSERLALLQQHRTGLGRESVGFSVREIEQLRSSGIYDAVVEYHTMTFTLLGGNEPERVTTGIVSWQYFDFLGVAAQLGRTFLPVDEGPDGQPILVLSHEYWQSSHGGDPHIIGKSFVLNDRSHRVVGVLPPVPQYPGQQDIYMPVSACPTRSRQSFIDDPSAHMMGVVARLPASGDFDSIEASTRASIGALRTRMAEEYRHTQDLLVHTVSLQEALTATVRPILLLLVGATGLVLLSACANVANLSLARILRRQRESAVRTALGAGRGRLLRQQLAESTLLALAGGVAGIGLAAIGLETLVAFAEQFTTRAREVRIDSSVLAFTLAVTIVTGLLAGLIPSLPRMDRLVEAIKSGSRRVNGSARAHRVRAALIVAQVTASMVLLIGSALMLRSVVNLYEVDPGFETQGIANLHLHLNPATYRSDDAAFEMLERARARIAEIPGVVDVALANSVPFVHGDSRTQGFAAIDGPPPVAADEVAGTVQAVTPGYFATLGVPILSGRDLNEGDHAEGAAVAVISLPLAQRIWGEADPLGARVRSGGTVLEIVGVVGGIRRSALRSDPDADLYVSTRLTGFGPDILMRLDGDREEIMSAVYAVTEELDPQMPVLGPYFLDAARAQIIGPARLIAVLLSVFAGVAILLAATGISGLVAYLVSHRSREIGIRMALGADSRSVVRMVLTDGLRPAALGVGFGVVAALVGSGALREVLFEVQPSDPSTYAVALLLALAVGGVACAVPVRRATRIDPNVTLQAD